jgi:hypothetical protein
LSVLANALRYEGDLDGALIAIREARESLKHASYPDETARLFAVYGVLAREGRLLGERGAVNLGRPAEAAEVLQEALDMVEGVARKDPSDSASRARVATCARELGDVLRDRDPVRALAVYDLGIRRLEEMHNSLKARRDHAQLLANSSYPLRHLHRDAEAKARISAAFDILKELKDYPADRIRLGSYGFAIVRAQADYEAGAGNIARSLELYNELLPRVLATKPQPQLMLADAVTLSDLYTKMAALNRRTGHGDRAFSLDAQCLAWWRNWDLRRPNNRFVRAQLSAANRRAESHWAADSDN